MAFNQRLSRRKPPPLPNLSRLQWVDVRRSLWDFMRWCRSFYDSIPGGFKGNVPPALQVGDTGSAGTEAEGWMSATARPPVPTGTPSGLANANTQGGSTSFPRLDHQHKRDIRIKHNGADVATRNAADFRDGEGSWAFTDDLANDEVDIKFAAVSEADLIKKTLVFWRMEEASGVRYDSVGDNHLTIETNGVAQAAGKIGNAGLFVAANQESLSILDNTPLSWSDSNRTITGWFYVADNSASRCFVSKGIDNSPNTDFEFYVRLQNDSLIQFTLIDNTGTAVTAQVIIAIANNTWYFFRADFNAATNTISLRINEGTAATASFTGVPNDTTGPFWVGVQNGDARWMEGRLDAIGVFNDVLTDAQGAYLYRDGNGREIYIPGLFEARDEAAAMAFMAMAS